MSIAAARPGDCADRRSLDITEPPRQLSPIVSWTKPAAGEFDRQMYEELVGQVAVTGEVTAA
ncbi:hypothetical protein WBG99_19650 [Streptomyces sp. TG1A-60]|uniref:hypothetical protein n=1 Tax=Streptomyces sp. TG1A-60 TaxID=3129111 RepID=UPI0030CA81CD